MEYQILSNHYLLPHIIDIIRETEKYCFIVTPYFDIFSGRLRQTLKEAAENKKRLLFIFSKPNEKGKEYQEKMNDIKKIKQELNADLGFDLYFVDDLHAKIYANEKEVLITSMNLTISSQEYKHEIGCLINAPAASLQTAQEIIFGQILQTQEKEFVEGRWSEKIKKGQFLDDD